MNDGVWFLVLIVCIAAILTVPGVMIALWRSTWIGIALNAYSFVMAGLAFVFVPLLLIKIDTGDAGAAAKRDNIQYNDCNVGRDILDCISGYRHYCGDDDQVTSPAEYSRLTLQALCAAAGG
jgi:ABC-type transport system involved in multi-copper enzyme maturation permease subunit